jgi:hypothetical protein
VVQDEVGYDGGCGEAGEGQDVGDCVDVFVFFLGRGGWWRRCGGGCGGGCGVLV